MIDPAAFSSDPTAGVSSSGNRFADLSSEGFVQVLVTEMSNQDPFKPNDSAALLEQLSSLRNIESQSSLQDTLESMLLQNSIVQSGSLIGREINGLDLDNNVVSGRVESVQMRDGEAWMRLDSGTSLPFERVTEIRG